MPKQKTHSGAKKRFKVTGTGKLLRRRGKKSHYLGKKSQKRKRSFRSVRRSRRATPPRSRSCSGKVRDATRQAIRPREQEAPQGTRPGEGLLGAQDTRATATRRSRSSTRSSTPTATARQEARRSGGSGSCASTPPRARTGSRTTSSSPGCKTANRARPQGARRPRGQRSAGVRRDRRAGEGRARANAPERRPRRESSSRQADGLRAAGSPLYAALCRRLADDPRVADDRAGRPALGPAAAAARRPALPRARRPGVVGRRRRRARRRAEFLARFVAEQAVQTNEVQRCWVLLPGFLRSADRAAVDLSSSAPSAGLNLVWDRYRYATRAGSWGTAGSVLAGEERAPVPAELLGRASRSRGGAGSTAPARRDDRGGRAAARVLRVGRTRPSGCERLRRAIEVVRADPPELVQGDFVDAAARAARRPPRRADRRVPDGVDVYLDAERYARLRRALARGGARRPSRARRTPRRGPDDDGYALEAQRLARRRPCNGSPSSTSTARGWSGATVAMIVSRDNEKLKLVRKLHERRWRDKLGLFFVEGEDCRGRGDGRAGRAARRRRGRRAGAARGGLDRCAPAARGRRLPPRRPARRRRAAGRRSRCGTSPTRATSAR